MTDFNAKHNRVVWCDIPAAKVAPNGGKVTEPVHAIGPHGFRALMLDSEGNRIALHSSVDV